MAEIGGWSVAVKTWNKATATILAGGIALLFSSSSGHAQDTGETTSGDAAASTAPSEGPANDYNRELRTVEEQVSGLKERVFRSKATLELLKEVVIQGASAGSNATIWHINKLGGSYSLESISYFVDGQSRFSKTDPKGSLDESKEFKVYEGAIPPGEHNITVDVRLRGNGFGIFKYVEKYEVNFKANSTFTAEEGKTCQVQVVLQRQKGIGKSFTERPNVAFQTRCTRQEGGSEAQ